VNADQIEWWVKLLKHQGLLHENLDPKAMVAGG